MTERFLRVKLESGRRVMGEVLERHLEGCLGRSESATNLGGEACW